jgi:hypothetical protein
MMLPARSLTGLMRRARQRLIGLDGCLLRGWEPGRKRDLLFEGHGDQVRREKTNLRPSTPKTQSIPRRTQLEHFGDLLSH